MDRVVSYCTTEDFIRRLADYLELNFLREGKDISRLAFVFGGKRPALFLKRELSQRIKRAYVPPRFFSIDEFVEYSLLKQESFRLLSDLEGCFTVFQLAGSSARRILAGRERFSQFLPWAREILSFVEQLDFEDISAEALKGVQSKAAIGYDVPDTINAILEDIVGLREKLHATMVKNRTYSRGLVYLNAARRIEEADFPEFDAVLFCGFFYLHKTEERIIKTLYDSGKAMLFFQGDEDEWSVLKRLGQRFSCSIKPPQGPARSYSLSIQAGFDVHSEVSLVREILKKTGNQDNTVIVLPEPEHMLPLLAEISGYTKEINVSMGYPLRRSSLYSLFDCIFRAQETRKGQAYYARDYLRLLGHPLVKNLALFAEPAATRVLVHKIEEVLLGVEKTPLGGSLFFGLESIEGSSELFELARKTMAAMGMEASREDMADALRRLHRLLFVSWERVASFREFAASLAEFMGTLVEKGSLDGYPLNVNMAERIFALQEEFAAATFKDEEFQAQELFRVFKNRMENEAVAFLGSPLKGLQVLGLFETRSLNFENVIIMDVNESSLPRLKIYEPLIPREVMISLGLNRLEKEEEIQRYQFRRLVQSAKNVYLVYQKRNDKEKSRFIEELIWERQKDSGDLRAVEIPQARFKTRVTPGKAEIKKTGTMISHLEGLEYSASSINTYLHCPMRFYYQYVLGLRKKEDLLDEPQAPDIGTFIHGLLEETFSGFLGRAPKIDAGFREGFFGRFRDRFSGDFEKKMKSDAFLIREILAFRLERFLDNEEKRNVSAILGLEEVYRGSLELNGRPFRFIARIDRIDRLEDGSILVVDYKTGGLDALPETDPARLRGIQSDRLALKETVRSFQLPLYLYFVHRDQRYRGLAANAALYSLRDMRIRQGLRPLFGQALTASAAEETMQAFLGCLAGVVGEITSPDAAFVADEKDARQCQYCPFFYLCR